MSAFKRARNSGFTVVELVLGATLTGLILLSTISFFTSVNREVVRPDIVYGGYTFKAAPFLYPGGTASNFNIANDAASVIDMHLEFSRQLAIADMVHVFGGSNVNPSGPTKLDPIKISRVTSANSTLRFRYLSYAEYLKNPGYGIPNLTTYLETVVSPYDFTVVVVPNSVGSTCAANVRRYTSTFNGNPVVLYLTHFYLSPVGNGVFYSSTSLSTQRYYAFWIPENEDVWSVPVGAKHYWYRNDASWWTRTESAGSSLVFPDPIALSVAGSDTKVKPMSRFTYFVKTFSP